MKKITVLIIILSLNAGLFAQSAKDKSRALKAYRIARKYIQRGNLKRAKKFLIYAHKKHPSHELIFARLVDLLKRMKNYKTLTRYYENYATKNKNNAQINHNMGTFAMKAKLWKKAIEYLKKAVALNPNLTKAAYDLSLCYLQTKEFQKSIKYSLISLRKNYNAKDALRNLVKAHMEVGLNEAAMAYSKELVKRTKRKNSFALDTLAVLYAKNKNYKKAIDIIKEAMKIKTTALFKIRLEKYKKLLNEQQKKKKAEKQKKKK